MDEYGVTLKLLLGNFEAMAIRTSTGTNIARWHSACSHARLPAAGLPHLPRIPPADRLSFSHELMDVRDLDGEALLAGPQVSDKVLEILKRLKDWHGAGSGFSPAKHSGGAFGD